MMKRNLMLAVLLAVVMLPLGYAGAARASRTAPADDAGALVEEARRVLQGFAIAPVPLDLAGKDQILVGLGSYYVNGPGACAECHTEPAYLPGGNPFLGQPERINTANYLAGGRSFGPFVSRNLTPDAQTGLPAGLTFEQFLRAMRTGEDIKRVPPPVPSPQRDTLQVMPWPQHAKATDRDLRAIYEYLSAVPHAEPAPRP